MSERKEFYRDEHPEEHWSEGGGGGGGSISGDGAWHEGGIGENPWFELFSKWGYTTPVMRIINSNMFAKHKNMLITGSTPCMKFEVFTQIEGDSIGYHVSCLLTKFVFSDNEEEKIMTLFVKWQKGHYDIASIHSARFKIFDVISQFKKIDFDFVPIALFSVEKYNIKLLKYL